MIQERSTKSLAARERARDSNNHGVSTWVGRASPIASHRVGGGREHLGSRSKLVFRVTAPSEEVFRLIHVAFVVRMFHCAELKRPLSRHRLRRLRRSLLESAIIMP